MPAGADAVVPVEQTDDAPERGFRDGNRPADPPARIAIFAPSKHGDYVRPVGEDIQNGQVVLHAGRLLRAADLGVLAGLGLPRVEVVRRPLVAIFSTGDELLEVEQPLAPGKIRDTNSYSIAALAQGLGARTLRLGIARDTVEDVRRVSSRPSTQAWILSSVPQGRSVRSMWSRRSLNHLGPSDFGKSTSGLASPWPSAMCGVSHSWACLATRSARW
jgi:molybdopterin molybdotransferase